MLTCNFLIKYFKNKSIKEKENLQKMEHFLINKYIFIASI